MLITIAYKAYVVQSRQISKQTTNVFHGSFQDVLVFVLSMGFHIGNKFGVHVVLRQFVRARKQFLDAHAYIQQTVP